MKTKNLVVFDHVLQFDGVVAPEGGHLLEIIPVDKVRHGRHVQRKVAVVLAQRIPQLFDALVRPAKESPFRHAVSGRHLARKLWNMTVTTDGI